MTHNKMLDDAIEKEKRQEDYIYTPNDRAILDKLFHEINLQTSINLHYLAELDYYKIPNSGIILRKYIHQFESESVKGYLLPHIINDRLKNSDVLVLELYVNFRSSCFYIAPPNKPAPAHIYTRYDTAFARLKSKKIATELIRIIQNPRDAYYLPLTTEMLAKWQIPEMEEILLNFFESYKISSLDIGIEQKSNHKYFPSLETIQRQLRFLAIRNLKYFPSFSTYNKLKHLEMNCDDDIRLAIKKTIKAMEKEL